MVVDFSDWEATCSGMPQRVWKGPVPTEVCYNIAAASYQPLATVHHLLITRALPARVDPKSAYDANHMLQTWHSADSWMAFLPK